MKPLSFNDKLKSLCLITLGGVSTLAIISIFKENERFYKTYLMPIVRLLNPEQSHRLAIVASKYRLLPRSKFEDPEALKIKIFGKQFSNPVGLAAGFDKHAESVLGLTDIGFGFIEIGSVTPLPQPGNEKPRVFRLANDLAVINRYGFNSDGHLAVFERLEHVRKENKFEGIIGVNLGKNKLSEDAITDYVSGIETFGSVADYIVINVSSPNTPGLRSLQNKKELSELLKALVQARNKLPVNSRPALLLKLAPDLSYEGRRDIAEIVTSRDCSVDGLIICNTTIERPLYLTNKKEAVEEGGLSGKPLIDMSTKMIADMYKLTKGMPIIGVGGIFTGKDAYDKIKAGAVVIQIYTAMIYEGPTIVTRIKKDLHQLLKDDGYKTISEAVGKDVNS